MRQRHRSNESQEVINPRKETLRININSVQVRTNREVCQEIVLCAFHWLCVPGCSAPVIILHGHFTAEFTVKHV